MEKKHDQHQVPAFTKTITKVIEYMEKLEVLEATTKQPGNKKSDKDKSEDKNGKFKSKTKKFPKQFLRIRARRERVKENKCCSKFCAICKAKGGPF